MAYLDKAGLQRFYNGIKTKFQLKLISGTNLKTINNNSLLGSGNIDIQGGSGAVNSVNGKTGTVVLDAEDVGALPDDTVIPTKTSDLTNDSGFLTSHQDISGKADKRTIKNTMDSVAVVNADYYLGSQSSVAVVLPASANTGDMIIVIFYSGATASTLSISGSYLGTLPTPSTNQRIELNLLYDGTNWCLLSNVTAVA